jgi:hypothetical protein
MMMSRMRFDSKGAWMQEWFTMHQKALICHEDERGNPGEMRPQGRVEAF